MKINQIDETLKMLKEEKKNVKNYLMVYQKE